MSTPMDINPNFTEERLVEVAKLLADVRAEVVDFHDKGLGDTNKSLGIRVYECSCTHLIRKSLEIEWLDIITSTGRFTFSINGTPVRFWKGQPEQLPSGKLIRSSEAMRQLELFSPDPVNQEFIWYFVLSTDHTKLVDRAFFVGYTESGEVVVNWEIPISSKVTWIADINGGLSQGVELGSAVSKIKVKKKLKNLINDE